MISQNSKSNETFCLIPGINHVREMYNGKQVLFTLLCILKLTCKTNYNFP